jgi:hypothetical protein
MYGEDIKLKEKFTLGKQAKARIMEFERQPEFRRNEKLEELLSEINRILEVAEAKVLKLFRAPRYPLVFIVGCPRAGSTLMMQWLAKTGKFAYPSNLLSRFYGAPYIGAKIQQLLTDPDYDFNREIFDFGDPISFNSNLGKTKGALEPNEFWYFWRRFIPNTDPEYLDNKALMKVDTKKFVAELAAIEAVFDKPLAMKGHILQYNIPFLSNILEKVLFVFIKRDPLYNIQSLLEARIKYFGDRSAWYSVKPREYDKLKELDPFEQIAGQVYFTNKAVKQGLEKIDISRWLQVNYEDFCDFPDKVFGQILARLKNQGMEIGNWEYEGPKNFQSTNWLRLSEEECREIIAAYKLFSGTDLTI